MLFNSGSLATLIEADFKTAIAATLGGGGAIPADDVIIDSIASVRFFHTFGTLCTLILAYSSRTVSLQ